MLIFGKPFFWTQNLIEANNQLKHQIIALLKEVDKETWDKVIREVCVDTIFNNSTYLEVIAEQHNTKISYWICYLNSKAILGFGTHIKRNSIVLPDHYNYSSFWYNSSVSEISYFESLEFCIKQLLKRFKKIEFRLPPHIEDIRAFNLFHSKIKVNYTYLNDTDSLGYRKDINRKLNIAFKNELSFRFNGDYDQVLDQQLGDFQYFGYPNFKIKFYKQYFKKLIEFGVLKSFSVYFQSSLLASALILIDEKHFTAYNLLLSNSKKQDDKNSITFLYHHIFLQLKQLNIHKIDLYGADMKGIAIYKSGFSGELITHYTIKTSRMNYYFERIRRRFALKLKRLI